MFTEKDIQQIESKGLTPEKVNNQIKNFKQGFSYLNISRPATINDGIIRLTEEEIEAYIKLYEDLSPDSLKFIPASGAASRMFKFLFEFYEKAEEQYKSIEEINDENTKKYFKNIKKYAFYDELKNVIESNGQDINDLQETGRYKEILKYFLFNNGLNYGQKPKGVLCFHKYKDELRTAFEEHLYEGALYSKSSNNVVNIHFTISPEHKDLFLELLETKIEYFEKKFNVKYEISFSQQKPSTDMVAVDLENQLFRNSDGSLLFRPGGHGALIENLNELDSDIIFIKNIDNVVPDGMKDVTVDYKKALAGVLLSYQENIFNYIDILNEKDYNDELLTEIKNFIKKDLCYDFDKDIDPKSILEILNRPIRVCGMVKNEGEPGGGPFWVKQTNGILDLQIVESSQIDPNNETQNEIAKSSTHFNPVDLVCATKNKNGNKFDLLKYRDLNTGFISKKSKDGRDLKAQELPGLWNGAMANWNTIFVEVPIDTFNPVKTVNDLLRPEHQ